MLQEPLEERRGVVGQRGRLSGLGGRLPLAPCLDLLTVAQQGLQQVPHPALPLPEPLDHRVELCGGAEPEGRSGLESSSGLAYGGHLGPANGHLIYKAHLSIKQVASVCVCVTGISR